MSPGHLGYT